MIACLAAAGVFLSLGAGAAQAAPVVDRKPLRGTVGPGFTISMSKQRVVKGYFRITIRDRSSVHNFHLVGPGIDRRTLVGKTATVTWNVRLKPGVYRFYCDPHPGIQNGRLRVRQPAG
jgi:plastocyanin